MTWQIELTARARKELGKVAAKDGRRIIEFLRRLESMDNPRQRGKALRGELAEFWRFRVGRYRLICEIQDQSHFGAADRASHSGLPIA